MPAITSLEYQAPWQEIRSTPEDWDALGAVALGRMLSHLHVIRAFEEAVLELDGQGRLLLPPILRQRAAMDGEVVVSAQIDHLEVWNRERLERRFDENPFGDDDFRALAERGI